MSLSTQFSIGSINLVIIIIIAVVALVLALIYRLGYFGGKRSNKGGRSGRGSTEVYIPQSQPINKPPAPLVPRDVPQPGGRSLLIESKPMEVRPLQAQQGGVDIERIEKLIKGLESTLIQVLKQSSSDTADLILSKISELRRLIEDMASQCLSQASPFTLYGYTPGNLADFKDLFRAKYVGLVRNNVVIEYVGEPPGADVFNTIVGTSGDLVMYTVNSEYIYMVKYNDLRLIMRLDNYLDPLSVELLRLLYRRYVDEVVKLSQ
ncbi:hypothetical protein [Vulcanisaeta thermophila]|uniref:hypothetical protein n=1 Tax=Vulcanisaeta thermophila TaxID=867917 RepID=UPI000A04ADFE|nr:hypothetical protein [Vulcanisaeta thermophila]